MRAAAAETLLLTGLLLLAGFVVWDAGPALGLPESRWLTWLTGLFPGLFSIQAVAVAILLIGVYWALKAIGYGQVSFWLMAGVTVLPHAVPIWGHNELQWYELVGLEAELVGERAPLRDAALFLASLTGIVILHRVIGLRALSERMRVRAIAAEDGRRVLRVESLLVAGLLAASLSLALLAVLAAVYLGRYDEILSGSTWAVAAVGGGAGLLLALTLLQWRRDGDG